MATPKTAPGSERTTIDPAVRGSVNLDQQAGIELCRDAYGGTRSVQLRGEVYLPRYEREEDTDYAERLGKAVFWPAFSQTADALAGMVFRREPELGNDVPDQIQELWENVDNAGRHGSVFLWDVFLDALIDGHSVILVDYPRTAPGQFRSRADELSAGLRPYWVQIAADDILGFSTAVIGGETVVTHLRYLERTTETNTDTFAESRVERVIALDLMQGERPVVQRRSWVRVVAVSGPQSATESPGDWSEEEPTIMAIPAIPIAVAYGKRQDILRSAPPLEGLAYLNVQHYQKDSDLQHAIHIACTPIPILIGVEDDDEAKNIGVNRALKIGIGGDAKWMELHGNSISEAAKDLDRLKEEMATVALQVLQRRQASNIAAATEKLHRSQSDSQLAAMAQSVKDAAELALMFTAMWLGIDDGGSIGLNLRFDTNPVDPQLLKTLSEMEQKGQLTLDTLLTFIRSHEVIPDLDVNAELDALQELADEAFEQSMEMASRMGQQGEQEGEAEEVEGAA